MGAGHPRRSRFDPGGRAGDQSVDPRASRGQAKSRKELEEKIGAQKAKEEAEAQIKAEKERKRKEEQRRNRAKDARCVPQRMQ